MMQPRAHSAIAAANSTEALETALRSVAEKVERPLRDGLDAVAVAATSAALVVVGLAWFARFVARRRRTRSRKRA